MAFAAALAVAVVAPPSAPAQTLRASVRSALFRTAQLQRAAAPAVPGLTVPGIETAASSPRFGTVATAAGFARVVPQTPLRADALFHIGSMTKTFTAALILELDEAHRLTLSDPISKWIPYPDGAHITVRMALQHTSGIPDIDVIPDLKQRAATLTPSESVRLVARYGHSLFAPGRGFHYSNTNYLILGLIAEKITRMQWHALVQNRFLTPLGLRSTSVFGYGTRRQTVTGYDLTCLVSSCTRPVLERTDGIAWKYAWAAGAVVSSAADVARWFRALVGGRVLDRRHLMLMEAVTPQSVAYYRSHSAGRVYRIVGYGLGLFKYTVAGVGTGWGHSGEISGFTNDGAYFPRRDLSVVALTNVDGAFGSANGVGLGQFTQAAASAG